MRFRELLLEYDRSKTAATYGENLVRRFFDDPSARRAFPRSSIANIEGRDVQEVSETVVAFIEPFDPSPNKKYVRWLVQTYVKRGIRFWEDLSRANDALAKYDRLRPSGYFARNPEANSVFGDIMRIKDLSGLEGFLDLIEEKDQVSNAAKDRAEEAEMIKSGAITVLYDDASFRISIPKTVEASCLLGRNTKWCTAATTGENYFNQYASDGPLYVVLDKKNNRRWQLHFETGQYMNERDEELDWEEFPLVLSQHFVFTDRPQEMLYKIMSHHADHYVDPLPVSLTEQVLSAMDNDTAALVLIMCDSKDNTQVGLQVSRLLRKRFINERKVYNEGEYRVREFEDFGDMVHTLYEDGGLHDVMLEIKLTSNIARARGALDDENLIRHYISLVKTIRGCYKFSLRGDPDTFAIVSESDGKLLYHVYNDGHAQTYNAIGVRDLILSDNLLAFDVDVVEALKILSKKYSK